MSEQREQAHLPWPLVIVVAIGLGFMFAMDLGAAHRTFGLLLMTVGAGGLVSVAMLQPEPWIGPALRWSLVLLGGTLIMELHWASAMAFGLAVFGLAWTGGGERRY